MIHLQVVNGQNRNEYQVTDTCTIREFLQKQGFREPESPCGGKGICRKCRVRVEVGRQKLMVLACRTRISSGMCIYLEKAGAMEIEKQGMGQVFAPDAESHGLAAACDIGTTTVVCHLLDPTSGKRLACCGEANAQRSFGADVITRIRAAAEGYLEAETSLIRSQVADLLRKLCEEASREEGTEYRVEDIRTLAVAGNTVMCHLFAGLSPESIGQAPFTPLSFFGKEYDSARMEMPFSGKVRILPAVSGFVGGDITADLLALRADREEGNLLLLDLGTNGELVLKKGKDFYCCATAAGPAFEGGGIEMGMPALAGAISSARLVTERGRSYWQVSTIGNGQPVGICGSGLLDAAASMRRSGMLDETGAFTEEGMERCMLAGRVYLSQADIRQLQLAKAAVAAGIRVLLQAAGLQKSEVEKVILCGGFGSRLKPASAAAIGLIPAELADKCIAAGNTAAEGVVFAAWSGEAWRLAGKLAGQCHYLELAQQPDFGTYYMEEIDFG